MAPPRKVEEICVPACFAENETCYFVCFDPDQPPPILLSPPPPSKNAHHPSRFVIVVAVLSGTFLLLSVFGLFMKYSSRRGRSLRNFRPSSSHSDGDDGRAGAPASCALAQGLEQSVIDSIAMVRYKRSEARSGGADCSVCLTEFREGESLRLLPNCGHAFHLPCIDAWLKSHPNCPLCRSKVSPDPIAPPLIPRPEEEPTQTRASDSGLGDPAASGDCRIEIRDCSQGASAQQQNQRAGASMREDPPQI